MSTEKSSLASLQLLEPGKQFPERRQQTAGATPDRRHHLQSGTASSERIAAMLENAHMFKDLEW